MLKISAKTQRGQNWRLSTRRVVNLAARLPVYHPERPPYLFAPRLTWCSASRGFVSGQTYTVP